MPADAPSRRSVIRANGMLPWRQLPDGKDSLWVGMAMTHGRMLSNRSVLQPYGENRLGETMAVLLLVLSLAHP